MFAGSYFAGRYFAPGYWSGSGTVEIDESGAMSIAPFIKRRRTINDLRRAVARASWRL